MKRNRNAERRRRENRGPEGAEGGGIWGGSIHLPSGGGVCPEACSVGKRPASLACILASTQQARLRNGVLKQSCITYHLNAKK